MINIKNLSFNYKHKTVLKDLNIILEDGKTYGLIGKNGTGKTTLFNCLNGKLKANSGEVIVDGIDVTHLSYLDNPLTIIDNSKIFFKDLTVREHLNLYNTKSVTEINEILSEFNLLDYQDNFPSQLSLGTSQRLNIALRMQNLKSNNILADEPFNGLDIVEVEELKRKFMELKKQQYMLIISSHNILSLASICDEILFLKDGDLTMVKAFDKVEMESVYERL